MDSIQRLTAIEEIRQLKARYWFGIDQKDAPLLRAVFTDGAEIDFRADMPAGTDATLPNPDEFVEIVLSSFAGVDTIHHGHSPIIEFSGADAATAIWPMEDNLWVRHENARLPFKHLHGYGFYHDRYIRTEAGWRISATTLKRVNVEVVR